MRRKQLQAAIQRLAEEFEEINWERIPTEQGLLELWPGDPDDDIQICVAKSTDFHEPFHRQDFFFLNYAYRGSYGALSEKYDNNILVQEDECYIGRPAAQYAIYGHNQEEAIIIGVLIQTKRFLKDYLPLLAGNTDLFRFFLTPETSAYSDEFLRLSFTHDGMLRSLLEWMVIEFANRREDTQQVLRPLAVAMLQEISRKLARVRQSPAKEKLSDMLVRYIEEHYNQVSLQSLAEHFAYHPNYISGVLSRETGKGLSQHVRQARMTRAQLLLQNTDLSIADISEMLGYTNTSNFYKAFKEEFGTTPRQLHT